MRMEPSAALAEATRLLGTQGWLSKTPANFQAAIISLIALRQYVAGAPIAIAGDEVGGIWGVVSGQIAVSSAISLADAPIAHIGLPGSWWGIAPIFGFPRAANSVAHTATTIAMLPQIRLQRLLAGQPAYWQHIGALAFEQNYLWGGAFSDMMIRDSPKRLIAVLLRLTERRMIGSGPVSITITQQEIAWMANVSRFRANQILGDLAGKAVLELGYNRISVSQPNALRELINSD